MPETTPPTGPDGKNFTGNEKNEGLYSPGVLGKFYTPYVIWFSHRAAWGVSNKALHDNHRTHIGQNHLTVGPGNGYFLAKLPASTPLRTLRLLDLNRTCLDFTTQRVGRRFDTSTIEQDALAAWPVDDGTLDSVDCHMMIHTLRGDIIGDKEELVAQAARVLKPGGVFFGATILAQGPDVRPNALARKLMALYNGQSNTFSNANDSSSDLKKVLERHFSRVEFEVQGCTGVWVATK
ncbi:class I SAM-dependent methyltransferase [Nocardiopsis ansamitocini]|uniref:Methyltransferase type 11 domain-containing protein n=1 Tax=Nocardiopsis ansamitocini TaxID=1670832 RepID=A0A9W6UHY5_9ACTN|nr:class I SAM-dependent methyltransferase [Nocardiopsis ansamitocini]GLU47177.1 hypothetical protein Nans01_15280 [Nocardiopsis ansamitocini]